MKVSDFPRELRFKMVRAYPVNSGVKNVYEVGHDEIDQGFARLIENRHHRRTLQLWLDKRQAAS